MRQQRKTHVMVLLLWPALFATVQPIMVEFGTNPGPIVPRLPPAAPQARALPPRSPAPVSEQVDDVPNPSTYRPPLPRQYRTRLLAAPPGPLRPAADRGYAASEAKYQLYAKQNRHPPGPEYTGPQFFVRQSYETADKIVLLPSVAYVKPHYFQHQKAALSGGGGTVPQIGVFYSAGVKYYVPQFAAGGGDDRRPLAGDGQSPEDNSVYDRNDVKAFYRNKA